MASTASKTPVLRQIATRGFAAQANVKAAASQGNVEVTKLSNELVVATVPSASAISRVSVLYKAGSRYESHDNLGATHLLRIASNFSNRNTSGFGVMRNLQQIGANLSCTSDREVLEYNLEVTRDKLDTGLRYLQDVSTAQLIKPWELDDNLGQVKGDLARVNVQTRAIDLLHRAAFRTGLGNSLFCAKHHVGKLSPETLQHYVATYCRANRAAVVGVGVDHQLLVGYAKNFLIDTNNATDSVSKFNSGELRVDKHGDWAHVAIATEGGALTKGKEALAFAVLQQIAGDGVSVKYGQPSGTVGKAVAAAVGSDPVGVSALNASYTDNGLFGVVLSAESKNIGKAIDAALKTLKGSVASADVNRGKEKLKAAVLLNLDVESNLVSDIGIQVLLTGAAKNASELLAAIDGVSEADVNAAAKKVASGKWAVGAVGNLANVPHSSDL